METPTLALAFLAGFLSFVSPCVLPLVPAYIGYLGGRITHRVAAQAGVGAAGQVEVSSSPLGNRFSTVIHGAAFVIGFAFVFVSLGLLSTAFLSVIGGSNISLMTRIIGRVGGVIIIFFGLHFMGVLPAAFDRLRKSTVLLSSVITSFLVAVAGSAFILWGFVDPIIGLPLVAIWLIFLFLGGALTGPERFWTKAINTLDNALYSDTRRQMVVRPNRGLGGSAFMGVVFSAGWTPCIGPIYGAVLTLAANTGDVGQAAPLLLAYSLGLGIPFLLTALLLDGAQGILRRLQRHMRKIELFSGAFLVIIGVLVATGRLQEISQTASRQFADFSIRVETCVVGFATNELYLNHVGSCLGGRLLPTALDEPTTGRLERDDQKMEFVFRGVSGDRIDIQIDKLSGALTPAVTVVDPNGAEVARSDSGQFATGERDALLVFQDLTLASDGLHLISVTNLQETLPDTPAMFSLTVARSGQAATPGDGQNTALTNRGSIEDLASVAPVMGTDIGETAPEFAAVLDSGQTIRLSDLRGKVVVLNFWATWCGPCRREMPQLERVFREHSDDGLAILAVNNRESLEDVLGFRDELALTFPLALDEDGEIQALFGIVSYPSTYVLDRNGVIIARHFGVLAEVQLQDLVSRVLS